MSGFGTRVHVQRSRPRVFLWPDGKLGGRIDLSRVVDSVSASKQLQSPAGQWSITVLPWVGRNGPAGIDYPTDLQRLLRPQSVISIGHDLPGGVMLGLADGFQRVRSLAGARAGLGLTIRGSDMAKVLVQDSVVHAALNTTETPWYLNLVDTVIGPENALAEPITGVYGPENPIAKAKAFEAAQITAVVEWAVSTQVSTRIPLLAAFGGTGQAKEWLKSSVQTYFDGQYLYSDGPKNYNGNLWGFLKSIVDEDFFEVILDSLWPSGLWSDIPQVQITVRPKPFDELSQKWLPVGTTPPLTWDNMTTRIQPSAIGVNRYWRIEPHEVLREDIGISDADVMSYFEVTSDTDLFGNHAANTDGLRFPLLDLSAVRRGGVRSYQGRLNLVDPFIGPEERTRSGVTPSNIREFRNRLLNWYRMADWYEGGTITVVGRDHYRVGDKVFLPHHRPFRAPDGTPAGTYFYVVGTQWSWSTNAGYTCTLRLTRGHNEWTVRAYKDRIVRENIELGGIAPNMVADT